MTSKQHRFFVKGAGLLILAVLLFSCSTGISNSHVDERPEPDWTFLFKSKRDGNPIPIRATVKKDSVVFKNGNENIAARIEDRGDSIIIMMPVFGTYFLIDTLSDDHISGSWINPFKDPVYIVDFEARPNLQETTKTPINYLDTLLYSVSFKPEGEKEYPAVGVFVRNNNALYGTFLTETGDYRFLEGRSDGSKAWMSCFDGAHLFYFEFDSPGDSIISGGFYSGNHYHESWTGILDNLASLRDPDSLTAITTAPDSWTLSVFTKDLESVTFDPESLEGKVTLIQVMGTWCPNCMDESRYFKELHQDYGDRGLQILPIAFERGVDSVKWQKSTLTYQQSLDLPYPFYIGGSASKGRASEVFHMLSTISSFPTTLFIDRTGTIRRVHTGFYGPGTGKYYEQYQRETKEFIEELLNENYSSIPSS